MIALVAIVITIPLVSIWWQYSHLRDLQHFISSEYRHEIAVLASAAIRWDDDGISNDSAFLGHDGIRSELNATFAAEEFQLIGWSFDGHHGNQTLKNAVGDFSYSTVFGVKNGPYRSLHYGVSGVGQRLLVYEERIVNGPRRRELRIVFSRDRIEGKFGSTVTSRNPFRH